MNSSYCESHYLAINPILVNLTCNPSQILFFKNIFKSLAADVSPLVNSLLLSWVFPQRPQNCSNQAPLQNNLIWVLRCQKNNRPISNKQLRKLSWDNSATSWQKVATLTFSSRDLGKDGFYQDSVKVSDLLLSDFRAELIRLLNILIPLGTLQLDCVPQLSFCWHSSVQLRLYRCVSSLYMILIFYWYSHL